MTNPRTLLLSIAATACCFIFTLAGVAGPEPTASAPVLSAATAPGLVSAVSLEPAASDPAYSLDATDRADCSASRVMVRHDGLIRSVRGGVSFAASLRR